jgi:protein-S-isoprenylcysteine O-methyltransferase Ste14
MNIKRFGRHVAGYVLGIVVFLGAVPYAIWIASTIDRDAVSLITNDALRLSLAALVFATGMVFVIWSNLYLFLQGRGGPVDIAGVTVSPRTKELVIAGPYKYTRNPMVFGVNSVYLSIAIYLDSLAAIICVLLFFSFIVKFVVSSEEKRLENDFGEQYREYKERTRKIVPIPRRI